MLLVFAVIMSMFYNMHKFTGFGAFSGAVVVYLHWLLSRRAFAAVAIFGVLGTLSSSFKKRTFI